MMDNRELGIAFDIGTTSIAASLIDMSGLKTLATVSAPNPQRAWGADLLARVRVTTTEEDGLKKLTDAVTGECTRMIAELTTNYPDAAIETITAAGNTVMTHLLLGVSPAPLGKVPYKPAFKEAKTVGALQAGIGAGLPEGTLAPGATLYALPTIGGFVGGDASAVALALGLQKGDRRVLAIDLGTNSEILLSNHGVLSATSAAAGPAFEAGEIGCGMVAAPGAIEGVKIVDEHVELAVIGGTAPKGICGSGLVEAASALIEAGVVQRNGQMAGADELDNILSAKIKSDGKENRFILSMAPSGEVALTQTDIRSLQVAKSAIRAGIAILLRHAKLENSDIETVYIAGAFGAHLSVAPLAAIGLIEPEWQERIEFVGDAALDGAVLTLSGDKRDTVEKMAEEAKYLSLSGSAHFQRDFMKYMDF
ncbi:MAG: DUF4445 domain-containing protein [Proteobacteria bacterium]|nr:DUF4445 domain-containing protein [Pseudomonadota bacterium]